MMQRVARERLDKLLVDRGLVASRERARALVMAGTVLVRGQPETKPGTLVDPAAEITLREQDHPYVSRGALKLVKGLDAFAIDPTGLVRLDIGASTGGFTDLLLRRGATRVYAIDVGYGQLAWSLRAGSAASSCSSARTSATSISRACPSRATSRSSMSRSSRSRSCCRAWPSCCALPAGKPIVALVKPQFEVGRGQVGKGGVVRDEAARLGAVDKVRSWATEHGFTVGDAVESPITGPAGNVEYLLRLATAAPRES